MSKSLSLTEQLAKHLQRKVDDATRDKARLHLLDWLGCVAGARLSKVGQIAKSATDDALRGSALLGGVLEMDDVDRLGRVHPGPVVWPAAMMEARHRQCSMNVALDGAVRGYEAMTSVARMLDDHHYAHWHPTHTAGRFGAAAAGSSIAGQGARGTAHALAIAGSSAGAFWQVRHEAATSKAFHVADAVLGGLLAGDLAQAGMTGPLNLFEGPQGLFAAMCKAPGSMVFSKHWLIGSASFKPWGACRHAHPVIDSALELQALLGKLDGEILVETYADAIAFCDNPDPKTVQQAKFSLQHAVAVVATNGVPTLADFEPVVIRKLAKARARVAVRECKDITARYPQHYGARVTSNSQVVEMIDTLGDPERPMSETQIADKALMLMAWGGLSDKQAKKAVKLALEGDDPGAIHKMLGKWLT